MTEIERLQAEVNQLIAAEEKEFARLKAVNTQLLEALEAIHAHTANGDNCPAIIEELSRAAIKAATEG